MDPVLLFVSLFSADSTHFQSDAVESQPKVSQHHYLVVYLVYLAYLVYLVVYLVYLVNLVFRNNRHRPRLAALPYCYPFTTTCFHCSRVNPSPSVLRVPFKRDFLEIGASGVVTCCKKNTAMRMRA